MNLFSNPLLVLSLAAGQFGSILSQTSSLVHSNVTQSETNFGQLAIQSLRSKREDELEDVKVTSKEVDSAMGDFMRVRSVQQARIAARGIVRAQLKVEKEKRKLEMENWDLKQNLSDAKKTMKKIGVIDHYRVLIERFHWNHCSMNSNVSAKVKKMKTNLGDEFLPPDLIHDRDNAKKENDEKSLQKSYDDIASFNRRYKLTVATVKYSEDSQVAEFVTQLNREIKRTLSAHEVGLLVASFYSALSKIDHDYDLEDDIDWEDEEGIKTALKSWKFDGDILDLAIAFHRCREGM